MHVDAIGAVVDLRDAQIDEFDKRPGQPALEDVPINAAQRFHAAGARGLIVHSLRHAGLLSTLLVESYSARSCRTLQAPITI
jgi:hypothetical protein